MGKILPKTSSTSCKKIQQAMVLAKGQTLEAMVNMSDKMRLGSKLIIAGWIFWAFAFAYGLLYLHYHSTITISQHPTILISFYMAGICAAGGAILNYITHRRHFFNKGELEKGVE